MYLLNILLNNKWLIKLQVIRIFFGWHKIGIFFKLNYYIISKHKMTLRLASGSYDGTIRFWDPGTGTSISNETINLSNTIPNKIEIS